MTCCERLALVINTALTVSLGHVDVGRGMLTQIENEPPLCDRCKDVKTRIIPEMIAGMQPYGEARPGMKLLGEAVSLLTWMPWDKDIE